MPGAASDSYQLEFPRQLRHHLKEIPDQIEVRHFVPTNQERTVALGIFR